MDDSSIIELFFNRDERAISEVKSKYGSVFAKTAAGLLNQKEDSEECINSALLALWNQIPPDRPNNLCAYACKIIKRKSINKLKHSLADKRNAGLTVSLTELEECFAKCEALEEAVSINALTKAINSFLRSQDEINRNIFIRRYWFNDSVSEIAMFYNLKESNVATRLFRTRKKLKEYLVKEGYFNE